MGGYAYLQYALGFMTPYVRADLNVPDSVAALPSSIAAVGLAASGLVTSAIAARLGARTAARLWIGVMALAAAALATRASLPVVLGAAFAFGIASGGVLVHVNSAMGSGGGHGADTRLVRANLWAVAGAILAPLVLSRVASTAAGWAAGLLVPIPLLVVLAVIQPAAPVRDAPRAPGTGRGRLSVPYWLAWVFIVLGVSVEFSFVVWGSSVVAARGGLSTADATGLGSLFVAGMIAGRTVLSTGVGSGARSLAMLRASMGLAGIGAFVVWLATNPALAGAGLFVGGLGASAFYPLGVGLALARAPDAPIRASSLLTLASGLAIFSAPLVLGLVAQFVGVVNGWPLVFGLVAGGLVILWVIVRFAERPLPVADAAT